MLPCGGTEETPVQGEVLAAADLGDLVTPRDARFLFYLQMDAMEADTV